MKATLDDRDAWDAIAATVAETISASPEPFAPATILNSEEFVRECRLRCPAPEGVAKGYWSTIRIWWKGMEVEVFDDRYELYRFTQGDTRIACFEHAPGREIPLELVDQLPRREQMKIDVAE
jgi:hypothetical protein